MKNLVSGLRPTGKLHLGHYISVLKNLVSLQNTGQYNCYYFVADWHSLTTRYTATHELRQNIIEVTKDFLACGIDPAKSTIYMQSAIPEIAELHLLLSMITPNNWVERDPTLKDLAKGAKNNKINELTYGMLGYPVLQTADILMFSGELVPVGRDQVAHLEMSRDIARRFNQVVGQDIFPECKPMLTDTPMLKGIDGNKMSKSFNNDIKISATPEETIAQVKKMITDSQRLKLSDAGSVERCEIPYPYYQIFSGDKVVLDTVMTECHSASRGCVPCKVELAGLINEHMRLIRERRESLSDSDVWDILQDGNARAKAVASQNMSRIREAMGI